MAMIAILQMGPEGTFLKEKRTFRDRDKRNILVLLELSLRAALPNCRSMELGENMWEELTQSFFPLHFATRTAYWVERKYWSVGMLVCKVHLYDVLNSKGENTINSFNHSPTACTYLKHDLWPHFFFMCLSEINYTRVSKIVYGKINL